MNEDLFNTLPMRRFLKKCVDLYKETNMEAGKPGQIWWDGEWRDSATGSWIECPFCKNTGKHLCPDVAQPIEIECTHKQCPVVLKNKAERLEKENAELREQYAKDYEVTSKLLSVTDPHRLEEVEEYHKVRRQNDQLKGLLSPIDKWAAQWFERYEAKIEAMKKEITALTNDNKKMFVALANDGRFDEDMERIKVLEADLLKHQFMVDRMRHHVNWAIRQDNLSSAINCINTALSVAHDIEVGLTPVPKDFGISP